VTHRGRSDIGAMMRDLDESETPPRNPVARLEALCRRLGQPLPDEDGIETYCRQMALSEAIAVHRRNALHKLIEDLQNDYTRQFKEGDGGSNG
jgi:hypothetical protein